MREDNAKTQLKKCALKRKHTQPMVRVRVLGSFLSGCCCFFQYSTYHKTFVWPFYATSMCLLLRLLRFFLSSKLEKGLTWAHTHINPEWGRVYTRLPGWAHLWFLKWLLFKAGSIHKITNRLIIKPNEKRVEFNALQMRNECAFFAPFQAARSVFERQSNVRPMDVERVKKNIVLVIRFHCANWRNHWKGSRLYKRNTTYC